VEIEEYDVYSHDQAHVTYEECLMAFTELPFFDLDSLLELNVEILSGVISNSLEEEKNIISDFLSSFSLIMILPIVK
jgi:hypothetical protein